MRGHAVYGVNPNTRQREARRCRYIARITSAPDVEIRLAALLARFEQKFEVDHDDVDRLLDGRIDLSTEQVALFAQIGGGP
jgi:hypothetical protein